MCLQSDLKTFLKCASGNLQIQVLWHMTSCPSVSTDESEALSASFTYSNNLHPNLNTRILFLRYQESVLVTMYLDLSSVTALRLYLYFVHCSIIPCLQVGGGINGLKVWRTAAQTGHTNQSGLPSWDGLCKLAVSHEKTSHGLGTW